MIVVRKIMTKEIIEYSASDEKTLDIDKCNIKYCIVEGKDYYNIKHKHMNLNETRIDGRYFHSAKELFTYLIVYKSYEMVES